MNEQILKYLRGNTTELLKDTPYINWLLRLDNYYLKQISNNIELTTIKKREEFSFINYLINSRY